jgi:hypothetical protein
VTDHQTSFFPEGRDRGVTVAVEGVLRVRLVRLGDRRPRRHGLVVPLAVGGGLAVLLTVVGIVLTTRTPGRLRVMADPVVRRRYSIVVGLGFGLLGAGATVLGTTGQDQWIPVWICADVGFGLVTLLAGRPLYGDPSDGLRLPRSQPEGKA